MKVLVTHTFRDINNLSVVYKEGEKHEFDDARAMRLIAAGNAEAVKDEDPTVDGSPDAEGNGSPADDEEGTTDDGVKRGRRKRNVE